MAAGRVKGDHEARRITIAEAACVVFLKLGLARTSLADIAREMGYTTGVLRHYFVDKDELLLFAKNLLFDRSFRNARTAADSCIGLQRLRTMAIEFLPLDKDTIDSYRLLAMFNGNAVGDARLMKVQHKRNESHTSLLADEIVELQKGGFLPKELNARLEATGILALIDGLAEQVIMRPEALSRPALEGLVNRYIDYLARSRTAGSHRA
jgi:AcrR family transcriptional regulator